MKSLTIIFQYIRKYPGLVAFYFLLNFLSAFFSLISLTLLAPFLALIFGIQQGNSIIGSRLDLGGLTDAFYGHVSQLLSSDTGKIKALGFICTILLTAILLKNLFLYLSLYVHHQRHAVRHVRKDTQPAHRLLQ
jgi:subfamily B ATP-binding cassette protein MsbA